MIRARIGVYDKAIQAIADHGVTVIIRSVDIPGLDRRYPSGHDHPHSVVLTHLIERIDEYAATVDDRALLIADEVSGQDGYRRDLWLYQRSRTWGYRARKIKRVVDTIHFAPSSSSRLVQAADLVAFLARRIEAHVETDGGPRRPMKPCGHVSSLGSIISGAGGPNPESTKARHLGGPKADRSISRS